MLLSLTESEITKKLLMSFQSAGEAPNEYTEIEPAANELIKCAAVLLPLVWFENNWNLLYTRRTDRVESHKGQVSFPGGACDFEDRNPEGTALREAREELGIQPEDVKILGRLSNLLTISYYRVTPVVGIVPWPYVFRVENTEVARVFTIPMVWLAAKANRWQFRAPGSSRDVIFYHPYDGELLWGATARITVNFLETMGIELSDTKAI